MKSRLFFLLWVRPMPGQTKPKPSAITAALKGAGTSHELQSAKFERIHPAATTMPLLTWDGTTNIFSAHFKYQVPPCCDASREADDIHCLVVEPRIAMPLNEALSSWALLKERRAAEAASLPTPPLPGKGSPAGYQLSNQGGYQSFPDVFDARPVISEGDAAEMTGRAHADVLHGIVSRAIDLINRSEMPSKRKHRAIAWVNVNRPGCTNRLHTHPVRRWSAVYYVANALALDAEHEATDEDSELAGHLIFRTGAAPADSDHSSSAEQSHTRARPFHARFGTRATASATHGYFAVPPSPGTLCVFPGSLPHCVLDMRANAKGGPDEDAIRISIAINFSDASPGDCPPHGATRGSASGISTQAAGRAGAAALESIR